MTRAEAAATSNAEYEKDKQSRSLPGGRAGPNKDGATAPDGASALGNEMGAEGDAQRERAQAIREGDILPPSSNTADGSSGGLGFGQQSGYEKGYSDNPSMRERDDMQASKNDEWQANEREWCLTVTTLFILADQLMTNIALSSHLSGPRINRKELGRKCKL